MSTDLNYNLAELTEFFTYLDDLRESGVTNMFGAGEYLRDEFGMDRKTSSEVLSKWMSTFSDAPASDRALIAKSTGK